MRAESASIHQTDDQLMEAYFLALETPHLEVCRSCRSRYEALVYALDAAHDDALQQADAVFTPDRLHEQRDRVLRRLERQGHPAEVLKFPDRFGHQRTTRRLLLGPARRWVAGAAAAGLVAGVFLGFAVDRRVTTSVAKHVAPVLAESAGNWQQAPVSDEQTLNDIEDALNGPTRRVMELRALDAMTIPPDLQEASFVPR